MVGLQGYAAFAAAVRRGSFAGAARELGLSPSAVAKAVARLEDDLGLRVFVRSTRRITLTSEGHALYARCSRIIDELDAIRSEAEGARGEPSGVLRLNVPVTYGRLVVVPALVRLAARFPRLEFDVAFSDQWVDLVRLGLDAVVRVGPLPDSSLVARRIGGQGMVTCAAPAYLRRHGTPRSPSDVTAHSCLLFRLPSSGRPRPWQYRGGRPRREFMPPSRFLFNEGEAIVAAAAAGAGLAQVPDYMAAADLKAGRLVEVLASYRPPEVPISLVYALSRQAAPRLHALNAALQDAA